jgi:hypothetical protein
MAKTEIGSLSMRLSANATEFEKTLASAEKRMTQFAAKVTSPISTATRIGDLALGQ